MVIPKHFHFNIHSFDYFIGNIKKLIQNVKLKLLKINILTKKIITDSNKKEKDL